MNRTPPTLDMTPDGRFRTPPGGTRAPWSLKLLLGAAVVAIVGGSIAVAALALWVVASLLPVIVIAAGLAWATHKYRLWRRRSSAVPTRFQ